MKAVSVFISSTCYDLVDLRFELADALRQSGFLVKMSEDPLSGFHVDPEDDSIGSCLSNVVASDAVICIIDGRYGGVLKEGPNKGKSATQLEVECARESARPIFYFIRDIAFMEFGQLRRDDKFSSKWVEPHNESSRRRWTEFVRDVASLPTVTGQSNWCDQFKSVLDLKLLVRKRLFDQFPRHVTSFSMRAERILRIAFVRGATTLTTVDGYFMNIGPGPAYNVLHGVMKNGEVFDENYRGGLAEGDKLVDAGQLHFRYVLPAEPGCSLFCEYANRFGDRYRVEVPLIRVKRARHPSLEFEIERFCVHAGGTQWIDSTAASGT